LTAQQEQDVIKWFKVYRQYLKDYNIKRRNIVNFDEAGFRVGCAKGQWILVPEDVLEYYSLSPENRRSLTIFEAIYANGRRPPPPVVVIQGKHIMADWITPEMDPDMLILTSEKGFTNNEIAVQWLKHFIQHSDAGP
jgi:hypothetical protein